ncbi:MAG: hypothetical protein F6K00_12310 [Leptolyngbya sp. SIOISBB]|nr:hypothetical protein [Leptolyngbya sp. SIOISBB]
MIGKARYLIQALLLVVVMTIVYQGLSRRWLQFTDIQPGAVVSGTDYVYEFEAIVIALPTGKTVTQNELYLRRQADDTRFLILLKVWPGAFAGQRCHDCVSVIQVNGRTHLVVRLVSEGSGGYYINQVVEIVDDWAIRKDVFLSCGRAYLHHHELVFPRHAASCPEGFWGHVPWNQLEYATLNLSEL